jgi:hypothetical protein
MFHNSITVHIKTYFLLFLVMILNFLFHGLIILVLNKDMFTLEFFAFTMLFGMFLWLNLIVPMLFVKFLLIGQKSMNLNIHTHLKCVTSLNYDSQYIRAILIFNKSKICRTFTNLPKMVLCTSSRFIVKFRI